MAARAADPSGGRARHHHGGSRPSATTAASAATRWTWPSARAGWRRGNGTSPRTRSAGRRPWGRSSGCAPGAVPRGIDAFLALVHPADRELVRGAADVAAERGGTHELRFRARWPDGSDHWLRPPCTCCPTRDGGPVRYVGITRSLDGRTRPRRAPEGERLFRAVRRGRPRPGLGRRCRRRRARSSRRAGWSSPDPAGGQPRRRLARAAASRRSGALRAAWERARDTREPFELEYRLRRGDGAWRWVLDRGRPIEDPDGAFAGWVGGCVDLHERAESEEEARLLSDAGRLLAGALEVEEHLDAVAALAVPALGDRCAIVAREDGRAGRRAPRRRHPGGAAGPWAPEGNCVVAPLVARGRAFGVLAAAAAPGRVLDVRELRIAQELANRVALALDGARLLRLARASEQASGQASAMLDAYVATAPVGLALYDAELRYQRVNEVLAEVHGVPAADHLGAGPTRSCTRRASGCSACWGGARHRGGAPRRDLHPARPGRPRAPDPGHVLPRAAPGRRDRRHRLDRLRRHRARPGRAGPRRAAGSRAPAGRRQRRARRVP